MASRPKVKSKSKTKQTTEVSPQYQFSETDPAELDKRRTRGKVYDVPKAPTGEAWEQVMSRERKSETKGPGTPSTDTIDTDEGQEIDQEILKRLHEGGGLVPVTTPEASGGVPPLEAELTIDPLAYRETEETKGEQTSEKTVIEQQLKTDDVNPNPMKDKSQGNKTIVSVPPLEEEKGGSSDEQTKPKEVLTPARPEFIDYEAGMLEELDEVRKKPSGKTPTPWPPKLVYGATPQSTSAEEEKITGVPVVTPAGVVTQTTSVTTTATMTSQESAVVPSRTVQDIDFYLPCKGNPRISELPNEPTDQKSDDNNPAVLVQIDDWSQKYNTDQFAVDKINGQIYAVLNGNLWFKIPERGQIFAETQKRTLSSTPIMSGGTQSIATYGERPVMTPSLTTGISPPVAESTRKPLASETKETSDLMSSFAAQTVDQSFSASLEESLKIQQEIAEAEKLRQTVIQEREELEVQKRFILEQQRKLALQQIKQHKARRKKLEEMVKQEQEELEKTRKETEKAKEESRKRMVREYKRRLDKELIHEMEYRKLKQTDSEDTLSSESIISEPSDKLPSSENELRNLLLKKNKIEARMRKIQSVKKAYIDLGGDFDDRDEERFKRVMNKYNMQWGRCSAIIEKFEFEERHRKAVAKSSKTEVQAKEVTPTQKSEEQTIPKVTEVPLGIDKRTIPPEYRKEGAKMAPSQPSRPSSLEQEIDRAAAISAVQALRAITEKPVEVKSEPKSAEWDITEEDMEWEYDVGVIPKLEPPKPFTEKRERPSKGYYAELAGMADTVTSYPVEEKETGIRGRPKRKISKLKKRESAREERLKRKLEYETTDQSRSPSRACRKCGIAHQTKECPCSYCHYSGHNAKICPFRPESEEDLTEQAKKDLRDYCNICGELGHTPEDCTYLIHLVTEDSLRIEGRPRYYCPTCGEFGHLQEDCELFKYEQEQDRAPVQVCSACGMEGHDESDCTYLAHLQFEEDQKATKAKIEELEKREKELEKSIKDKESLEKKSKPDVKERLPKIVQGIIRKTKPKEKVYTGIEQTIPMEVPTPGKKEVAKQPQKPPPKETKKPTGGKEPTPPPVDPGKRQRPAGGAGGGGGGPGGGGGGNGPSDDSDGPEDSGEETEEEEEETESVTESSSVQSVAMVYDQYG